MSRILIQDLADSVELDQQAMRDIMGGTRSARERLQQRRQQALASQQGQRLLELARGKARARR